LDKAIIFLRIHGNDTDILAKIYGGHESLLTPLLANNKHKPMSLYA